MHTVLILTRLHDTHVPPVAEEIRSRGNEVISFNLADFPEEIAMTATLETFHKGWSGILQHHLLDRLPLKEAMADVLVYPKDYCL
jgi:hypothetical protein